MHDTFNPRDWLIAVSQIQGIGRRALSHLLPHLSTPFQRPADFLDLLHSLPLFNERIPLLAHLTSEHVKDTIYSMQKQNIKTMTILDPDFPSTLREIPDPPFVVYAIGNMDLLNQPIISIIGTRTPTNYGRHIAFRMASDLSNAGFCIASGMARGVDGEAHKGALSSGADTGTIAVLGCGIDVVYPRQHEKIYREIAVRGLILSEYPPGTPGHRAYFPERNRLISGISYGVVVVEAASKSGTSITVDHALEQGKDVFAVPGSILSLQSSGPHRLIKDGAKLVTHARDIIDEYRYASSYEVSRFDSFEEKRLTDNQKQLLDIIENTQVTVDQICAASSKPAKEVLSDLVVLQMEGWLKQLPGSIFIRLK
jgi:DNA processing protein